MLLPILLSLSSLLSDAITPKIQLEGVRSTKLHSGSIQNLSLCVCLKHAKKLNS